MQVIETAKLNKFKTKSQSNVQNFCCIVGRKLIDQKQQQNKTCK